MPLHRNLAERYGALFRTYGVGGNDMLIRIKGRIAERQDTLREDAMYFLLVNMDHMIIRPLHGYIPDAAGSLPGQPMEPFVPSEENVEGMATRTFNIILDHLKDLAAQGKLSASDIVDAISAKGAEIAKNVAWWKED